MKRKKMRLRPRSWLLAQTKELAPCSDQGVKLLLLAQTDVQKSVCYLFTFSCTAFIVCCHWSFLGLVLGIIHNVHCSNLLLFQSCHCRVKENYCPDLFFFFFIEIDLYAFFLLLFTSTVFIISLYKSWFSTNENPCSKSHHGKPIIIPFKKILACDWMLIPYPCVFIELHCSFMWTGEFGLNKSWFLVQSEGKTSKARVEEKRILYSFWSLLTGQNGVSQAVNSTVFHPAVERCQCRFILSLWYCTGSESRCW